MINIPLWQRLHIVRLLRDRRVFQRIARRFDLVYFGAVSHEDDHQLVRGVTFSVDHHDTHYCVGSVEGYDITLLQRTDVVQFPGKDSRTIQWCILQIDVHAGDLPHIFLNAHRYPQAFYANLFIKESSFRDITDYIMPLRGALPTMRCYGDSQILPEIQILLTEPRLRVLAQFPHYDYETEADTLLIAAPMTRVTTHGLEQLLRAGLSLAQVIESE